MRAAVPNASTSPGSPERSAVLPVGTFQDLSGQVRKLDWKRGKLQTSRTGNSIAQIAHQDSYLGNWVSPKLSASVVPAGTWSFAISCSEQNASANSFFAFCLYVYTFKTTTIRGYVYDSDAPLATEWGALQRGRGSTFVGAAVNASYGDSLVLEVWRHAVQAAATAFAQTVFFDGTVDVVNLDSNADAASWINTPAGTTLNFSEATGMHNGSWSRKYR